MKRLSVITLLLTLFAVFFLSACRDNPVSETQEETASSVSEEMADKSEEINNEDKADESNNLLDYYSMDEIIEKYVSYLDTIFEGKDTEKLKYYLAYINADEVPELLYMEDNAHLFGVHVCVCDKNGDVYEVGEFGEYGNFSYQPQTGKILSFYMNNGCYISDFYKLEDCSIKDLAYFEIDTNSEGDDTVRYYVDGDEVDSDTYSSKYALVKGTGLEVFNYEGAFSYNDTEDILYVMKTFANTGIWPSLVDASESLPLLIGEWKLDEICFATDSEYESSEKAGITSTLVIEDNGNISVAISTENCSITDNNMIINYVKMDFSDPDYAYVGCTNYLGTRKYYIFTGENESLTVLVNDYSGDFDFDYFNAKFLKSIERDD